MSETISEVREAIINDPDNLQFKKLGYYPIFMASVNAKILIIGQAPGIKTQLEGQVFKDKSGERLREWLGVSEDFFYNSGMFAVLPVDFYFPGKAKTGDLPPREEFAKKWHPQLIKLMPDIKITILIGEYAQKFYLKDKAKKNLTQTVLAYQEYLPQYFVLPHPSPLNFRWFEHNPVFNQDILPVFQKMVKEILDDNE